MPKSHAERDFFSGLIATLGSTENDSRLLDSFVNEQNSTAFELLVRRHLDLVRRVCFAVLRDRHHAEDSAQAVFMILAKKAAAIRNRTSLVGWLTRTAYRTLLRASSMQRSRRMETNVELRETPACEPANAVTLESMTILHEEIDRLPQKTPKHTQHSYFEGISHSESACRLGWKLGSFNTRITRAREILHNRLSKRGVVCLSLNGLLGAQIVSPARSAFITETVLASIAFSRGELVSGVSPLTNTLVTGAFRMIFAAKLKWICACVVLLAATSFVAAAVIEFVGHGKDEKAALDLPFETPNFTPVLAPLPNAKEIVANKIREYESLGAVYGGFVPNDFQILCPKITDTLQTPSTVFQPGAAAAAAGLPGFRWYSLPEGEFPKLPSINVPFGIEISSVGARGLLAGRPKFSDADVKALASLKNLTLLNIQSTELTEEGVKELKPLKNLTSLALHSDRITDSGAKELAALRNLTSLTLDSQRITNEGAKELAALKKLTSLILLSGRIGNAGVKQLATLNNLESLVLWANAMTDEGVKDLAALKNLNSLLLGSPLLTDAGAKELASLNNLQTLSLEASRFTAAGIKELAALKKLTSLTLNSAELSDRAAMEFSGLQALTSLNLKSTVLTAKGLKHIAGLKSLDSLDLGPLEVTNEGAAVIAEMRNLKTLSLNGSDLTDEGVVNLARLNQLTAFNLVMSSIPWRQKWSDASAKNLAELKNLKSLYLGPNQLTDKGVKEFAALKKLTMLSLRSPRVTDVGVAKLAELKNLRSLSLAYTQLTVAGAGEIAKLKNLKTLDLLALSLTDDAIGGLISLDKLTSIHIMSSRMTDAGAKLLTELKDLNELELDSPHLTRAGEMELRKSLPRCSISVSGETTTK